MSDTVPWYLTVGDDPVDAEREARELVAHACSLIAMHFGSEYAAEWVAAAALTDLYGDDPVPLPGSYKKATIPARLRLLVFERDEYACRSCGDTRRLTVDHIKPESRGGPTRLDNLQTLCRSCNSRKGAR